MIHAHVSRYFLIHTNPLPVVVNLNTEVFPYNAYLVHHFSDAFTLIVVLPPLDEDISPIVPMEEDTNIQTSNKDMTQSFESNVEITGAT